MRVDERTRVLRNEILLVLGVSLGASAAYSVVSLVAKLTAQRALSQQTTALNTSLAPGRPWLDLTYQLMAVFFGIVPALLAIHLMSRDPGGARGLLGLTWTTPRRLGLDLAYGAGLAAVIGIPGLGLYLLARELNINTIVAPANLPPIWWAVPVLILAAAENAVLEEVVVVGYLVSRLNEIGFRAWQAVAASAVLRGSYHLYQGFGAFIGNAVMGAIFGLFFARTRRVLPLVIAHALLDIVAYLGYAALKGRVGFLS